MTTIRDSRPEIPSEFVDDLRELWSRGRAAVDRRWAYREAAAVLDTFDPVELRVSGDVPAGSGYDDYRADAEGVRDGRWRLRVDLRQEALSRLGSVERMRQMLARQDRRPDSTRQRMFEALLDNRVPLNLDSLGRDDLCALLSVRRWLSGVLDERQLPDPVQLERVFGRADALARFDHLLQQGFVDRGRQRAKLKSFLWSERTDDAIFTIRGIGGVGKSTLLAKFARDQLLAHGERIAVVVLDLDRPTVDPVYMNTLWVEIVNQLARQSAQGSLAAVDAIERLRELSSISGGSARLDHLEARLSEKSYSWHSEMQIDVVARFMKAMRFPAERILLIVDTFEEAQSRGDGIAAGVLHALQKLALRCGSIRVVVSGRAEVNDFGWWWRRVGKTLHLRNLDRASALRLLRRAAGPAVRKLDRGTLMAVLDVVGCSPLCIKLAASLIDKEGVDKLLDPSSRSELLETLKDGRAQTFLFGRILGHLHGKGIAPLVYPGMVVRTISPSLIREVLAPACDALVASAHAKAEQWFWDLRRETSVVEYAGAGALRFRGDLRRELLPDILRKLDPVVVADIDRRAVAYYDARVDESGDEARAEALYHRLRLGAHEAELDAQWRPKLREYLKGALDELPPSSRVWLANKLRVVLDAATIATWSQRQWEQQAWLGAERCLRAGNPEGALKALRARAERLPDSPLYRLEGDALRLLQRDDEARHVARKGLVGATGEIRVDLLLFVGLLEESRRVYDDALADVDAAIADAAPLRDPILKLRGAVVRLRLLRKLGRVDERSALTADVVRRAEGHLLRRFGSYPRLFEETVAEIAPLSLSVSVAAVERLGLLLKTLDQKPVLVDLLGALMPREWPPDLKFPAGVDNEIKALSWNHATRVALVAQCQGAGLGRPVAAMLKRSPDASGALKKIADFFQLSVDCTIEIDRFDNTRR